MKRLIPRVYQIIKLTALSVLLLMLLALLIQIVDTPFWNVLDLLVIPIVLAVGAFWLNQQVRENERRIADQRMQETALQTYLDRMTELLVKENLHESKPDDVVRQVARARTLAVLRGLDGTRKGILLRFLYESDLITGKTIVDLKKADLSGLTLSLDADLLHDSSLDREIVNGAVIYEAVLSLNNFVGANLSEVDLSRANLRNIILSDANLVKANLTRTNLFGAKLSKANLTLALLLKTNLNKAVLADADMSNALIGGANLSKADLSGAILKGALLLEIYPKKRTRVKTDLTGANLTRADLTKADLSGTNLRDADLTEANLTGVRVTSEQLAQVKSLKGTTMPNGTLHD